MLVKDLVNAIANKEIKVKDLAENYGTSDRTIQTKIKNLGFKWDSKERRYEFVGNDKAVLNMAIDEIFKSNIPSKTTSNPTSKIEKQEMKKEVKQKNDKSGIKKVVKPENNKVGKLEKKKVTYEIDEWVHDEIRIRSIREKRNVSDIVNEILKGGLK